MHFWWPDWQPRERSPSSDSKCSTASHSSLASDASFYSAASDGAGAAVLATARAGADPLGLGLRIVDPPAPVLGSAEPEMDPADPPRALPLLGTGAAVGAATSGTGPGPAAPIARQPAARLAPAAAQASLRSAASPSRRFATDASGRRPAGLPRDGPGPDTLAPSMPGSLHAQASQGPGTDEDGAASNSAAAQDAARGASSCAAPRPPPDLHARLARPGRAGGMLPVPAVPGAELAAVTARALAAAYGLRDPADDDSSDDDGHDGPADAGSGPPDPADVAAAPMDVDQDARQPTVGSQPLSPPPVLRIGGKRRRLNDVDDEDTRELAELLLEEEDEAGDQAPAPRLSAASARPATVLSVYAHNAQRFQCTLCTYTAASFATLKRHRDSRHRRTAFLDRFTAGCACGVPFASRLAAANHAHACVSLNSTTSAAAAPTAGELSPTAGADNATVTAAIVSPDSPRQDPPELAASPPLASSTHVAGQDQDHAEQQTRARWSPPLPRALVAGRVAARLS
ncbi:hypothetical protein PF010_g25722, partial [Phytophthora fragariae]